MNFPHSALLQRRPCNCWYHDRSLSRQSVMRVEGRHRALWPPLYGIPQQLKVTRNSWSSLSSLIPAATQVLWPPLYGVPQQLPAMRNPWSSHLFSLHPSHLKKKVSSKSSTNALFHVTYFVFLHPCRLVPMFLVYNIIQAQSCICVR
jgi:hypothetical protein